MTGRVSVLPMVTTLVSSMKTVERNRMHFPFRFSELPASKVEVQPVEIGKAREDKRQE